MASFNPLSKHDWDHFFNSLKGQLNDTANKAKRSITDAANNAKKTVNDAGNQAQHQVTKVATDAGHAISDTANKAEKQFGDLAANAEHELSQVGEQAKKELEHIRDQAFKVLAKGSINKAVDVIQTTAPDSFGIKLGPFAFDFDKVQDRIDTLQKYANNPPALGNFPDFVKQFAPASISVSLSAEIAFLLVASDSLSVGFTATYTLDGFISRYGKIRGVLGV